MPKKTWVNIGGTWRAVKNVWVNIGGAWKQKVIPKGNIAGVWKDFIQYMLTIYDSGVMYVPLVKGFTRYDVDHGGSAYVSFDDNEILLFAGAYSETSVVTDYPLDITGYQAVSVTWSNNATDDPMLWEAALVVSKNKLGDYNDHEAGIIIQDKRINDGIVTKLNISDLTGSYYIRVHSISNALNSHYLHIKNITLE